MLDVVFPPLCPGCSVLVRSAGPLCRSCQREHEPLPPQRRFESSIHAVLSYDGPWRRALHRLKYERAQAWAGPLGRCLSQSEVLAGDWDGLVAVPLHWRRWLVRGFNQVDAILDRTRLSGARRIRGGLRRRTAGQPQQQRTAGQREQLGADTFFVPARARRRVAGRRLLVIDDVVTTGATLKASMAALRAAGAAHVEGLALLRSL